MMKKLPRPGTIVLLQLASGAERPFLVVQSFVGAAATDTQAAIYPTCRGWLFHDPAVDVHDALIREQGIHAGDRVRPCYLTVPANRLRPV